MSESAWDVLRRISGTVTEGRMSDDALAVARQAIMDLPTGFTRNDVYVAVTNALAPLAARVRELESALLRNANLLESLFLEVQTDADHELVNKMTFQYLRRQIPEVLKESKDALGPTRRDAP